MTSTEPQALVLTVLDLARNGQFAEIRNLFAENLLPLVATDTLRAAWDAEVAQMGSVVSVGTPISEQADAYIVVVTVSVGFERGELILVASVTAAGELVGLQLKSADPAGAPDLWEPPPYADPDRFDEYEVTLGDGPLAVPGTLTVPKPTEAAPSPVPALVLLGGSGPCDRDGSIGKSKPHKDLAWGLASQNVAVLRFDKVTHAHPDEIRADRAFTVTDEYQPHALAAVQLLRAHPGIDSDRIFLAGHSLGGTVAPRIAAAEPSVAGLVILAGGAVPLHWAAIRQVRYLASLDPTTADAAQAGIDAMTAQAECVDDPDLSLETPDDQLPFGVPAAYWLDLRSYDPVAAAVALDKPMLFCQGLRDYQSTVADDLALWQAGLGARPDVTIRIYPDDNHFFFPGTGPSSPAELAAPQHLDGELVTDIRDWLYM